MGNSDSRAALVEAFAALQESDELPDAKFWSELWGARSSAEEIYELLGPSAVRDLRARRPRNLVLLFTEAVGQLVAVEAPVSVDGAQQALNAVRVLQRLLPCLLEDPADDLVFRMCWSPEPSAPDEDPLAKRLLFAVMRALFLPGFTVHAGALSAPGFTLTPPEEDAAVAGRACTGLLVQPDAVWAPGLGAPGEVAQKNRNGAFIGPRVEVLRLLLTALCEPLYRPAAEAGGSPWLMVMGDMDAPHAATLFFSLVNVVFGYEPGRGALPYAGHLSSQQNVSMVEKAAQALMVLLDEPASAEQLSAEKDGVVAEEAERPGVYRRVLSWLSDPKDFDFIYHGFARLLNNLVDSANTMLPSSVPRIAFYQEVLVLLWKVLEESEAFMEHVLRKCDSTQLVGPLCYLMHSVRHERHLVGVVHICTFVLLKLSGDRQLAIGCSKVPYRKKLPTDLPLFTGTYCDLLLITLHQVMMAGGDRLSSQYNCFLTIICNVSPYCKALSLEASMKLVGLFEVFVSRPFLYAAEPNGAFVGMLLETFCNLVQYQFEGNPRIVYALVRQRAVFDSLFSLTAEGALAEAREVAAQKAAKASGRSVCQAQKMVQLPFEPTEEWLASLKPAHSQMTLQCLIKNVSAEIDEFCQAAGGDVDETSVLGCISSLTMVGLLPVPHAIVIRQYQKNAMTSLWFTAQLWVIIFMQNQVMPLFDGGRIRLFSVGIGESQAWAARREAAAAEDDAAARRGRPGASSEPV